MTRDNITFEEDVIDRLARIETGLLQIPDHEDRIRALEKRQYKQLGAATLLSAIIGICADLLFEHMRI
jgi:hypothetical protein